MAAAATAAAAATPQVASFEASAAHRPSAALKSKRDVLTAPVPSVVESRTVEVDSDEEDEADAEAEKQSSRFDDAYSELVESRLKGFRAQKARSQVAASAAQTKPTGFAVEKGSFFVAAANPTYVGARRAFFGSGLAKCDGGGGDGEDEQQHFDATAGIEAIKRVVSHGTPARIHVALGKTDQLQLFVKRSSQNPDELLYATRLNDYESSSQPVHMMRTNLKTGMSVSDAIWSYSQHAKHGEELLQKAIKTVTGMITAAGVYDSDPSKVDIENN